MIHVDDAIDTIFLIVGIFVLAGKRGDGLAHDHQR